MKIFMLGWEYPPYISGGLGTACEGLTKSLAKLGIKIDFVVPRLSGRENAPHMTLFDASTGKMLGKDVDDPSQSPVKFNPNLSLIGTPALISAYCKPEEYAQWVKDFRPGEWNGEIPPDIEAILESEKRESGGKTGASQYGTDLFQEVEHYARNAVKIARTRQFDIIHAHDWMTYAAGIALARLTGKPLITHVHSLEYDRSGPVGNQRIKQIEAAGVTAATVAIAVSYYTRSIVNMEHKVPLERISVVHNGVYTKQVRKAYRDPDSPTKIVLFMGRITFQKGPDYFIEAAARVIPYLPNTMFIVAGTGDMLPRIQNRVHEMGLARHFLFPGFMKGPEVERMYSMADVYIMPSVSEPFGIAPLEAMSLDIPVIISKQSGVSEVLEHALKVDFWDIERMAHLIIGVLKYREVRDDIIGMAREEVKRIHWDAAAAKTLEVYKQVHNAAQAGAKTVHNVAKSPRRVK